jgi:hypothetical protein
MRNKQTWKELGLIVGVCVLIAIADKMLIIYFGYSFISNIFSGR